MRLAERRLPAKVRQELPTQLLVLVNRLLLADLEALGLLRVEIVCVVGHSSCVCS